MATLLPDFNADGDLPPGVYSVTLDEAVQRFGGGSLQRERVTDRLRRIYSLAQSTGAVHKFLVFGSYVTDKSAPNDVDIVLIMQDNFSVADCDEEAKRLFDHEQADQEFGASIFWIRPSLLILETLEEFIAHWQVKRDKSRRGILEIIP
jgi:predicted nucleotidyltransferase